jgi:hypothetical protein
MRSSPSLINAEAAAIKFSPFSAKGRAAISAAGRGAADRGFTLLNKPVNYRQALMTQVSLGTAGSIAGAMSADDGHRVRGFIAGGIAGGVAGGAVNAARIYGPGFHRTMMLKGGYKNAMSRGGALNFTRARRNIGIAASDAMNFPNVEGGSLRSLFM